MVRSTGFLLVLASASLPVAAAGEFSVPVIIEERAGVGTGKEGAGEWLCGGIPFPLGLVAGELPPLEIQGEGATLFAEGRVTCRWPDGSVRWTAIELPAPDLAPHGRFRGTLRPRTSAAPAASTDARRWSLRAGEAPGELFRLDGARLAAASSIVESDKLPFDPTRVRTLRPARAREDAGALSCVDEIVDADGNPVFSVTTRVTTRPAIGLIEILQTLDVLSGVHRMKRWDLVLPFPGLAAGARLALSDREAAAVEGDFALRQVAHDRAVRDGKMLPDALRLPGVVAFGGVAIAVRDFWRLFPKGIRRSGDAVTIELCPPKPEGYETLEAGFGRTHVVRIWLAGDRARPDLSAIARRQDTPTLLRAEPDWYCRTGALGPLAPRIDGEEEAYEADASASAARIFRKRDAAPAWNFGIQHFGDFFDREHSLSYAGALQQEYDPAAALFLLFARTGDGAFLDRALELARHYADVDVAPWGGCFQHRATIRHASRWIVDIFAEAIAKEVRATPGYDGTAASLGRYMGERHGKKAAARAAEWLRTEEAGGARGAALEERFFLKMASVEFDAIEKAIERDPPPDGATLRDYVRAVARDRRARELGFVDPDRQFAPFFALYGGSWAEFPSFHVDNCLDDGERHEGGHSLVEGVVFAHWLTGEPYFRDVALSVARHHVEAVVPQGLVELERSLAMEDAMLYTRTAGWPLVNLTRLWEMTEGIPEDSALRARIAGSCGKIMKFLARVPLERIQGSIHAGIQMEGMVHYHQLTGDADARAAIVRLARYWARHRYDGGEHGFWYQARGRKDPSGGMSGLCLYGLAYAQWLEHDPEAARVLADAWAHLPRPAAYAKVFGMLYRSSPRALHYMRAAREKEGK